MITAEQIAESLSCPIERAQKWYAVLNAAMEEFGIDTPQRIAAFIAQVGHESGRLLYVKELWGPTPSQSGYDGRSDLGNVIAGDGFKFRGRGLLQVTGRANYKRVGDALGLDLVSHPELLEQPDVAARSAGLFWKMHELNEWADRGDTAAITRRINGGINGLKERIALYELTSATLM